MGEEPKVGWWPWVERGTFVFAILSWLGVGSLPVLWKYLQLSRSTLLIASLVALVVVGIRLSVVQRDLTTATAIKLIRDRSDGWPGEEVLFVSQLVGDADFVTIRADGAVAVLVGIRGRVK